MNCLVVGAQWLVVNSDCFIMSGAFFFGKRYWYVANGFAGRYDDNGAGAGAGWIEFNL